MTHAKDVVADPKTGWLPPFGDEVFENGRLRFRWCSSSCVCLTRLLTGMIISNELFTIVTLFADSGSMCEALGQMDPSNRCVLCNATTINNHKKSTLIPPHCPLYIYVMHPFYKTSSCLGATTCDLDARTEAHLLRAADASEPGAGGLQAEGPPGARACAWSRRGEVLMVMAGLARALGPGGHRNS